jgi:uncharacterized repeat protein (TIGR02543 family)
MLTAKPAPPTARSGRIVLTLLFMLLTTASAWADVIVNITGNGTVTLNGNAVTSGTYQIDGNYSITFTPASGYVLQSVSWRTRPNGFTDITQSVKDNNGVHASSSNMMTDREYNVIFSELGAAITYALTSQISGSGTMTFSVGTQQNVTSAEEGAQVDITLSAPGNGKYWELSSQQVTTITQDDATHFHFTMPATAVTVSATLQTIIQTFYQIFDNSTNGHVAVSGGDSNGLFYGGETVTLTPTPDTGYEYVANSLTATNQHTSASIDLTDNDNGTWSFQMPTSNVNVSATFTPINYTVHFDTNGGSGTMNDQAFTYNSAQNLTANTFTREGYVFLGWSTTPSGNVAYTDGQSVSNLTDTKGVTVTLYAQWTNSYTVHFDANGGTGTMADQGIERNAATNLSPCTFTNIGLIFGGWSTEANGSVVYADGASVTNLAAAGQTITLYAKWIYGYTIHFDANGGTGTMADQGIPMNAYTNLRANTFTRPGYVFAGWSTTADGTGNSYADGASVTNLAAAGQTITLYAQWMNATQYTVHFDPNKTNGGTGTMAYQVIERDVATALSACTFTNSLGLIFGGWSTTANGSVEYADGASVTNLAAAGQSITLYAKWVYGYTVHFDANGGTGTMADQVFTIVEAKALTANTFTREGYVFIGWSTTPSGNVVYTDGQTVSKLAGNGQTITLYAQWVDTYTVHFDKNDDIFASGTMADQTFHFGETKQLSKCTFTGLGGYTFLGWSTSANGSVEYTDEQSVCDLTTTKTDITLYAQWQAPVIALSHIVHFDANGGTGTMSDQEYSNTQWANLNTNTFTRDGYTFTGWNTAADGSGDTYTNQQNIHPSSDMTLYAQWSLNTSTHYAVHFNANGGTGTMYDQAIAAGASADLTANAFTREGYTFTGWSTQANGTIVYLDGENVSHLALAGQTANLYAQWNKGAMTIAKEQGEIVVTLDGDSNEPFEITSNIVADRVILRRKFVAGVPTTICLPFAFSKANFDNETFSTLNYVDENQETHQLVAHMTAVNDLQANTPYYFEPSESTATPANENYTEIEFDNVTIVAGNAGSSTTGGWTIVGNYDRVKWTTNTADPLYSSKHAAELGRAYGYAKKTKTVGGVTYQEGQFVKLGDGAHTRAFRAYMLAPATNNSPGLNDLPDTIDVVWHNDDATGVTSMSDGRRQMSDVWYDLSGRKLSQKPTLKGIYIHGAHKVVIK